MDQFIDRILCGDCLQLAKKLPDDYVDLIITSPPYFGCRVYGAETLGREEHPLEYVANVLKITAILKQKLKSRGSFYLNIGDIYFGTKGFIRNKGSYKRKTDKHYKEHKIVRPNKNGYLQYKQVLMLPEKQANPGITLNLQYKQVLMLPERIAIGMQEQGWILRNKIIWEKPNPVPSYSPDRRYPVYEHIFHFVKARKYYFDLDLARQLKHHRDVIRNKIEPFGTHQASFPLSLIRPFIETTSQERDLVLDPFIGSGTTAIAALQLNRHYLGFELNKKFCRLSEKRISQVAPQASAYAKSMALFGE